MKIEDADLLPLTAAEEEASLRIALQSNFTTIPAGDNLWRVIDRDAPGIEIAPDGDSTLIMRLCNWLNHGLITVAFLLDSSQEPKTRTEQYARIILAQLAKAEQEFVTELQCLPPDLPTFESVIIPILQSGETITLYCNDDGEVRIDQERRSVDGVPLNYATSFPPDFFRDGTIRQFIERGHAYLMRGVPAKFATHPLPERIPKSNEHRDANTVTEGS